jgi:hypothetical protein
MTTTAPTTTPTTTLRTLVGSRERLQYLVIGLLIGALWIAHRDEPLWEHAARTLAVLVAVPLLAAPVLAWWRKRRGSTDTRHLSLVRFVAAKALLVGVALGVDVLLSMWIPGAADFIVAGGLFAAIAVLGPLYHHLLVTDHPRC